MKKKKTKEEQRIAHNKSSNKTYHKDIEWSKQIQKNWRFRMRLKIIEHYSNGLNCCACCGEKVLEFLTLDHINNNGTMERKKLNGGGHHNYRYIIKNGFPSGYQIMCYNCNCGRARTDDKICPHKRNENNKIK